MPDINLSIAANVRAELARAGLTARRASDELGWSHYILRDRVNGDVPFRADELVTIARHLGIPVDRFYVGTEAKAATS